MSKRFNKFPSYIAEKLKSQYGNIEELTEQHPIAGYCYKIPNELLIHHQMWNGRSFERYPGGIYVNYISFGRGALSYLTGGLTAQEYYDILVEGNVYSNKRPRCPNCGRFIPWGRNIGENYRFEFCNHACAMEYRELHPDKYPDWASTSLSNIGSWSDKDFYEFIIYKDFRRDLKKMLDINDMGYLYFIYFDSKIKIGVSSEYLARDRVNRACLNELPKKIEIYEGQLEDCLKIEYQIKLNNYSNLYYSRSEVICWTEYFTNLDLTHINLDKINLIN